MIPLVKIFASLSGEKLSTLEVTCNVNKKQDIDDLPLDEFRVHLYIDNEYKGDISGVLQEAGLLEGLIEGINWPELWADQFETA